MLEEIPDYLKDGDFYCVISDTVLIFHFTLGEILDISFKPNSVDYKLQINFAPVWGKRLTGVSDIEHSMSRTMDLSDSNYSVEYVGDYVLRGIDEEFFNKIDKGEKFSKGDIIEVELEILQKFDKGANTYIIKGYNVLKVFSHRLKDEQTELDI